MSNKLSRKQALDITIKNLFWAPKNWSECVIDVHGLTWATPHNGEKPAKKSSRIDNKCYSIAAVEVLGAFVTKEEKYRK